MRVCAGLVAVALAVLIGGCGRTSDTAGQRDATYLKQVNVIEKQLTSPLQSVTRASISFASQQSTKANRDRPDGAAESTLTGDLAHIRALERRLGTLRAPAGAGTLHGVLVRLAGQEEYLTAQTAKLVVFLPAFDAALRPLAPATTRLERALSVNRAYGAAAVQAVYQAKARALRSYDAVVGGVLAHLHRLSPPAVSAPDYSAQVRSLKGTSLNAEKLADAIQAGQTAGVSSILAAFDRAAVSNQTLGAQRAEIAAVRAYDTQTEKVNELAAQAEVARQRLAASLP